MICWRCANQVSEGWSFCPGCGHSLTEIGLSPIFVVDTATDLFNGVFIKAMIGQEVNRALRYRRPVAVLMVEVDHAESMRKDLRREEVNPLLRQIGQSLVAALRDTDTVGFMTGSSPPTFAVVLPETEPSEAIQIADALRLAVSFQDFADGGPWQRLTVSVGTAVINHERLGEQDLMEEAAAALAAGRGSEPSSNRTFVPARA